jgi:predicted membrane protein
MHIAGSVILLCFVVTVLSAIFLDVKSTIFIHVSGMVETLTGLVIGYYYGASKGGRDALKNMSNTNNPPDEI